MTADYNPTEAQRLIAEAREDDERMTRARWTTPTGGRLLGAVNAVIDGRERQVASACGQAPQFDAAADVGAQLGINADGIARTRNNLPALADQLEAACRLAESRRKALARELAENQPAMTDLIAKLESERDSLRQQLEAAQAATSLAKLESAPWARDVAVAIQRTNDLAAAQRRIAELESMAVSDGRRIIAVQMGRDALKARVAELESKLDNSCKAVWRAAEQVAEIESALRAIYPVYRAAVALAKGMDHEGDPTGRLHHDVYDSYDTASAAITPEIAAVLAEMEKP